MNIRRVRGKINALEQAPSLSLGELDSEIFGESEPRQPEPQVVTEIVEVPTLAVDQQGRIPAGKFTLTRCGLIGEEEATQDEWEYLGVILRQLNVSIQWLIGDWLVYGQSRFPNDREEIARLLDLDLHTLDNYAWVARSVPYSLRKESLSFGHHALIAALPENEQSGWLEEAETHQWSVAALRSRIANQQKPTPLSRGVAARVAKISARNRAELSRLAAKVDRAGRSEKVQISQLADEQIALWQELKRAVSK